MAVPPLTHQWKEKSVPRLAAATSKPPQLPWHRVARQPLGVVRCTLQTPLPRQPPATAQHGGEGEGCPWAALMAGLCSPLHRGFLHHPADAQPGWQGARRPGTQRPPSPGSPRATFVRELPGRREQCPAGQRLRPDTARIHGSSRTGAARGQVLPQPSQQNGHSGQGAGGCPGQTWAARVAGGTRHFPAGPGIHNAGLVVHQIRRTRCCSHAATRGRLSPARGGEWVAWRGQGHPDVPRVVIPKLPAHPALCSTLCVAPCAAPCTPRCMRKPGSALGVSAQESC